MSDLAKRLRDLGDHAAFEPHMHHTAADRIEELEAKLRWVLDERDATFALMLKRAETAEAKLAKVVELVERAFNEGVGEGMNDVLRQARRIEELEAKLAKAGRLLSRAIDMTGEPHCHYDHHGYCQAHNLEPRGECWVEQSQAFVAELTGGKGDKT